MSNNTRDELAAALWGQFGYPSEHEWEELPQDQREDWREDADALLASPVFARLLDQARAEAWDEGRRTGIAIGLAEDVDPRNPYRTGADQ